MNNLKKTIIWFLLLVPFRLPIGTLLIKLLDFIAQLGSITLPASILCGNVMVTKIIYNLVFSSLMLYSVEIGSRELKGRKAREKNGYVDEVKYKENDLYWWTVILICLSIIYNIFDMFATYDLFYVVHK